MDSSPPQPHRRQHVLRPCPPSTTSIEPAFPDYEFADNRAKIEDLGSVVDFKIVEYNFEDEHGVPKVDNSQVSGDDVANLFEDCFASCNEGGVDDRPSNNDRPANNDGLANTPASSCHVYVLNTRWGTTGQEEFSAWKKRNKDMLKVLGIPQYPLLIDSGVFARYPGPPGTFGTRSSKMEWHVKHHFRYLDGWEIWWVYCPSSRSTVALIEVAQPSLYMMVEEILEGIGEFHGSVFTPACLGLVVLRVSNRRLKWAVDMNTEWVFNAQLRYGIQNYIGEEVGADDAEAEDAEERSRQAKRVATSKTMMSRYMAVAMSLILFAEFVLVEDRRFAARFGALAEHLHMSEHLQMAVPVLSYELQSLRDTAAQWESMADTVFKLLNNMISQQTQKESRTMTEATHRDTAAVSGLSFIALVFLPTTSLCVSVCSSEKPDRTIANRLIRPSSPRHLARLSPPTIMFGRSFYSGVSA